MVEVEVAVAGIMEGMSEVRGGRRQAQCALCVLSCLLFVLGVLLPHLLPVLRPHTPSSLTPTHILPQFDPNKTNANHGERMMEYFGEGGCMLAGSGWITALVVMPDNSLVLGNWHSKALVVKSYFTEHVIPLKVRPLGVALLGDSSGRVAVTSGTREILLVHPHLPDHPVQRVATGKRYSCVTSGPTGSTLIVSTVAEAEGQVSVDIITLQGEVIQTLTDTARFPDLHYSHFLSNQNVHGDVVVSALDRNNRSALLRLRPSTFSSQWAVERWRDGQLSGHLWGTTGHAAWGVFIGQDDGVVLRTADDRCLRVLHTPDRYLNPTALAAVQDRLYVVWDHARLGDFVLVEYHLHKITVS